MQLIILFKHLFGFRNVKILHQETHNVKRKFFQTVYISKK